MEIFSVLDLYYSLDKGQSYPQYLSILEDHFGQGSSRFQTKIQTFFQYFDEFFRCQENVKISAFF